MWIIIICSYERVFLWTCLCVFLWTCLCVFLWTCLCSYERVFLWIIIISSYERVFLWTCLCSYERVYVLMNVVQFNFFFRSIQFCFQVNSILFSGQFNFLFRSIQFYFQVNSIFFSGQFNFIFRSIQFYHAHRCGFFRRFFEKKSQVQFLFCGQKVKFFGCLIVYKIDMSVWEGYSATQPNNNANHSGKERQRH